MNRTAADQVTAMADQVTAMAQAVGWYQTRLADREALHQTALDGLELVNLRLRGLLHSYGLDDAQIDLRIGGDP
ncbi:MAG TPA: hypothetical protein VIL68_11875 [Propionibacteriaceae bacterium]